MSIDLDDQSDRFIARFISAGAAKARRCEVHWVEPAATEQNRSFELPADEIRAYLNAMIGQGYLCGVRIVSTWTGRTAHLYLWEEWDGGPFVDRVPETMKKVIFEDRWEGYSR